MKADIDLKDKKILYLLLENGRLNNSKIASLVGVSKNTVASRIAKLKESGVIRDFMPTLNYDKLGLFTYDIFLRLRATEKQEKAVIEYFSKHPNVIWASSMFGKWDIFAQLLAPNIEDLEVVLKDVLNFLGKRLEAYQINPIVDRFKIDHQLFDFSKEIKYKFKEKKAGRDRVKMDELDKKIISCMNHGFGRASYFEIGKKIGASMETVRNRVLALQKKNIISHHMTFVNLQKLGFHEYIVFATLRNLTHEKEQELMKFIRLDNRIRIGFKTIGKFEFYFYVVVHEPKELERFVRDLKNNFFDILLETDYSTLTNEFRLCFFPKSLERL